jgi:hypothetical protein
LISGIFSVLRQYYWNLYATCELTTHLSAKSVFFFRYDSNLNSRQMRPLCISLNGVDKVRVIGGYENHVSAVANAIVSGWPEGIQEQMSYAGSMQFKLKGYPFNGSFSNPIYASVMMMFIMANLQGQGLHFVCSGDVSGKFHSDKNSSYRTDLSSWFFVY